jgi:hypothetical protein
VEITDLVERLELIEERFGLRFDAIYADYDLERPYPLEINFDVLSDGQELEDSRSVITSVYNEKGQLIATDTTYVIPGSFVGIESFSRLIDCALPARIRIYFS